MGRGLRWLQVAADALRILKDTRSGILKDTRSGWQGVYRHTFARDKATLFDFRVVNCILEYACVTQHSKEC